MFTTALSETELLKLVFVSHHSSPKDWKAFITCPPIETLYETTWL